MARNSAKDFDEAGRKWREAIAAELERAGVLNPEKRSKELEEAFRNALQTPQIREPTGQVLQPEKKSEASGDWTTAWPPQIRGKAREP